jgi:pimeloyl-ACP methyl ester carboxylesterase
VSRARLVDRLFEERDAAMVGSRLLVLIGAVRAREFRTLPALLAASYPEAEADAPRLGTPIPATLLGLQRAEAFDAIVVAPHGPPSGLGVVFLHGFAGNFALQCLEVARVARAHGALTICPSTRFEGDWWRGDGESITRASIAHLRARGAREIVLVGLSNGGIGASRLAPRFGSEIDGLVLLSGLSPRAPTPHVPTLVVQGDRDAMVPTRAVRAWARGRARVRYVELSGTHLVLLEERERVAEALGRALTSRARIARQ